VLPKHSREHLLVTKGIKAVSERDVVLRIPKNLWRPVAATALPDGTFVLAEIPTMPAGERWEFRPGSRVVVEAKSFDRKTEMVAVRLLREHR
jgi:hypothetical protein